MTAAAPVTYSPPAGTYGTPQTVTLSTETAGADIYYTVDGSEPGVSAETGTYTDSRDGKVYRTHKLPSGAWIFSENFAWAGAGVFPDNNGANVPVYGRLYTQSEAITNAPTGCHLITQAEVEAYMAAIGAAHNSSDPASLDAVSGLRDDEYWSAPGSNTLGFSARPAGYKNTSNFYGNFGIAASFITATGNPFSYKMFRFSMSYDDKIYLAGGGGNDSQSIRYIVDSGNVPDINGTLYTTSLTISETTTVKAIAVKTGLDDSAVASAEYVIDLSFLGVPISGLERGYSVSIDRHVAVREAIGGGVRLIPRAPAQSDVWTVDAEVMLTSAQAGPFEAAVGAYGSDSTGILNLPARGGASTFAGLAPAAAGADADTYIITAMRNPDAMGRRAVAVDLFAYRVQFDLIGSANTPIALTSTIPDWLPKKFAVHALRDSSQWSVYASPSTGLPIHPAAKVKHGRGQGHTIALDALDDSQADHLTAWYRNSRSAPVTITIDRGIAGQGAVSVYLVDLSLARDVGLYWSGSLEVVEA